MKSRLTLISPLLTAWLLSSCNTPPNLPNFVKKKGKTQDGTVEPSTGIGEEIAGGTGTDGYTNLVCKQEETHRGLRAWRRLSNTEIINTVKVVFAVPEATDFTTLLNDIPKKDIFDTVQAKENFMEGNRLKGYVSFAEKVSAGTNMAKVFPCMAEGAACLTKQMPIIGAAAWRRPLTADEITLFTTLYKNLLLDGVKSEATFPYIIQALILSPNFMYRSELGKANASGEFELTSWEIASALSYLLWRNPPDDRLKELAAKDGLNTSEIIAAEANRMLADPRAKVAMGDFAEMWLESKRILNVNKPQPQFTDAAKLGLSEEVKKFFVQTMWGSKDATYKQLLTSTYTVGDQSTAFVYGSQPQSDGTLPFVQEQRRGILGQGAYLASHALPDQPNPITRGVYIAERLLCVDFAPPPAVKIPEQMAGLSNKERFRIHSSAPACALCHVAIDPLGFAMENFDSAGVFRSMDAGQPIAINMEMTIDKKQVQVTSPQGLSTSIAESRQGMECFVRQTFRYTLGRMEYAQREIKGAPITFKDSNQAKLDQCQINAATDAMVKAGGSLKSAIVAMVSSPAFRIRLIGKLDTNALGLLGGEH
ncbi:MAG: DUF1592 domain-containing protein [Proteobacteria bacterium]|nr:MAG: DUF1592 domain-containing protein [Pseudomonadota bacterium]